MGWVWCVKVERNKNHPLLIFYQQIYIYIEIKMRSSTTTTTTSSDHEVVRLNSGITMPVLGMGTYSWDNHRETTESAVHMALQMGYRHFDTAKIYGSEAALGNALNQAFQFQLQLDDESTVTVDRDDVFVTSKLWGSDHHDPVSALRQSLKKLGMEYLDMYLVHWPVKLKPWNCEAVPKEEDFEVLDMESTWDGMQRCLDLELCTSIGVSNFSSNKILQLLDLASVPPAVNQVEMHPMWRQNKLREICAENEIHVSAYSPLGAPGSAWGTTSVVQNPFIKSIARKHNATPAQVALRWGLSKGSSVIVKSFNENRLKENIGALHLKVDHQDLLCIDKLEEEKIMRGDFLVNQTTSPYKTIQDLWDGEI